MSKNKEIRAIKFYFDDSINKGKKEKILIFLKECQDVENQLFVYYWNNFEEILKSHNWITFSYNLHKVEYPKLKSHHYYQVAQNVFKQLKIIENTIRKSIRFNFEDKDLQVIYNYCSKFCFDWDWLKKFTKKKLGQFKSTDNKYYNFLKKIESTYEDEEIITKIKHHIEERFWEQKLKFKQPVKKEFQISCYSSLTIKKIHMKEFQWIFEIDNNDRIGGTEKKGVYDKMIIPVKFSKYHKNKLKNKTLLKTFNIKLNKYNKIEIIGLYEEDVNYPEPKPKDYLGIDIGLKRLITTSDGEFVPQNKKMVDLAKRIRNKHHNRTKLMIHLRKKHDNDTYQLPDKNYLQLERKLTQFATCYNRYVVKNFLKSRLDYHIIIEDLMIAYEKTPNKESNYLLRRLRIQQLVNDLEKYCKQFGIKINKVNPAYTSQQCHVCGHTSKENRKSQEKFSCQVCDNKCNADYNAAVNIMNRYHDKRIKLDTPNWRIKEILGVINT